MKNTNKIVVIGVKYDSNLGDMLLGDCLCHLLSKEIPYANIDYIDMRGRTDVDKCTDGKVPSNGLYRKIRHFGGRIIRIILPQNALKNEEYLGTFFRQHLSDASAVIFAGGYNRVQDLWI